jgi:hypothetical protein
MDASPSDSDKIDFAKFVIDHNTSLINLADTKAGILLGINGIIIALLFAVEKIELAQITISLFLITGIFLGASSLFTIFTIVPRLSVEGENSRIYFMKIKELKKDRFISSWGNISNSEILDDLISNVYNLASIQSKKFKHLQVAVVLNIIGVGLLLASLFAYLRA